MAGGHALFHAPTTAIDRTAPTATPPQFVLNNVSTRIDTGRGSPVFVIRGEIQAAGKGGIVPNLGVGLTDAKSGQRVTYTIPRGELLQANESLGFTTRIPAGNCTGAEPTITLEGN